MDICEQAERLRELVDEVWINIPDLAAVDGQSLQARENVIVGIATIKTLLEEMGSQHPDAVNDALTAIKP